MPSSRFAPYRNALAAISTRTGSPLPSLIFSFAVLHELTAIVPLVGIFYAARGLRVGERVVNQLTRDGGPDARPQTGWVSRQLSQWVDDGEKWATRVGRRYGVFGFEKGMHAGHGDSSRLSGQLAGDLANAVVAYGAIKVRSPTALTILALLRCGCQALLPVRIGLSLYLSPAFSRGVVEPIRRIIIRPFYQSKIRKDS
ncbi:hypothetical protein J3R82DRAFT_1448 [Butyriboletus roseoflavus]|nr:hypothetical protein J3R82DRAFT_1448 [Butyriboletus roseoflavus]